MEPAGLPVERVEIPCRCLFEFGPSCRLRMARLPAPERRVPVASIALNS